MNLNGKYQSQSGNKGAKSIGRIVSVSGSQAIVLLDHATSADGMKRMQHAEIGTLLKVETSEGVVLGLVSALSVPVPSQSKDDQEIWIAELELVGELRKQLDSPLGSFHRGVSIYPTLGDRVFVATHEELEIAYSWDSDSAINIGQICQDSSIPAMVKVDELLGKHFGILGTTGTGKSCAVAVVLRSILMQNPQAHIMLLDPHNEYAASFHEKAEIISPSDLTLPYWFLTFEEIIEVLVSDNSGRASQIEILSDLIPIAKAQYGSKSVNRSSKLSSKKWMNENLGFSADTPVPYRLSDLLNLINDRMGMFEYQKDLWPLKQLKQRIEAITKDPRYAFMFDSLTVQDHMANFLGRMFRIPVNNKPITILQLTGLPSEVVNVVVSVLCRMTFDFGLWSDGMIPLTLVCEEAHRYIPNDHTLGFEPTRRAIARIAKEGRKYGVSLCIVSQRPSELDQTILSQCNTVFAMRMSNERDQKIVHAAVSDVGAGMLEFLPSLGTREAVAFGDGVPLPVRIRFNKLTDEAMPKGRTAQFTEKWRQQIGNEAFLNAVVQRWRAAGSPVAATQSSAPTPPPPRPTPNMVAPGQS